MFDLLVARSQSTVAAAELFVPLPEHAFVRAALSRLTAQLHTSRASKQTSSIVAGLTFVSGPEGSGKSLLTRHTLRDALHKQPKLRFVIADADELAELLALAEEQQSLAELLELFDSLDLLVCEDLQLLERKPDRQDLLLELVDRATGERPRILVTSRKLPGELRDFSSRWISRCHGGLCATLPWPGLAGRCELIARAAQVKHIPLCEPVAPTIEWLAERWPLSPRDIVQSLDQLAAACHAQEAVVNQPFLERWLSQESPTVSLTFDAIASVVAHEFGVLPNDLRSRSRHQGLIVPRQCAMFLAKELTGRPLESIGLYFGERTHTTVSHSLSRLRELLPHAPTLRQQVQKLRKRLAELKRDAG